MKLPFRTKARTKHAESRVSEHDDATHAPAGGDSNATPTTQEHLEQHHEDHLKPVSYTHQTLPTNREV